MNDTESPQVILMPGLDGSGKFFRDFCTFLPDSPNTTVISYPEKKMTFEELASHTATKINVSAPLIVIAESFSGPIFFKLIELYPGIKSRLIKVVLCATFCRSPQAFLCRLSSLLPLSLLMNLPIQKLVLKYIFFDNKTELKYFNYYLEHYAGFDKKVLASRVRQLRSFDYIKSVQSLTSECMYLQATNDYLVPRSAGKYIIKRNLSRLPAHTFYSKADHKSALRSSSTS